MLPHNIKIDMQCTNIENTSSTKLISQICTLRRYIKYIQNKCISIKEVFPRSNFRGKKSPNIIRSDTFTIDVDKIFRHLPMIKKTKLYSNRITACKIHTYGKIARVKLIITKQNLSEQHKRKKKKKKKRNTA